jgi:hypothetical protein
MIAQKCIDSPASVFGKYKLKLVVYITGISYECLTTQMSNYVKSSSNSVALHNFCYTALKNYYFLTEDKP